MRHQLNLPSMCVHTRNLTAAKIFQSMYLHRIKEIQLNEHFQKDKVLKAAQLLYLSDGNIHHAWLACSLQQPGVDPPLFFFLAINWDRPLFVCQPCQQPLFETRLLFDCWFLFEEMWYLSERDLHKQNAIYKTYTWFVNVTVYGV